jgi:catechol 2,3-dioxygenase-like lactoylglutathione lyase family enzyme
MTEQGSAATNHSSISREKDSMQINMVCFFVTDMVTMTRFYSEVMGFVVKEGGTADSPYTAFDGDGIRFSMFKRELLPGILGQTPGYPQGLNGTMEIAFNVGEKSNVDKVYEEWLAKGAKSVYAPRDEPWKMRSAMIADPEGNLVEIGSDFWK